MDAANDLAAAVEESSQDDPFTLKLMDFTVSRRMWYSNIEWGCGTLWYSYIPR